MDSIKRWMVDRWGERRDDFDWRVYQTALDLGSVGSVLVLNLNGKLGDALMISLLVDALATAQPDLRIAVGTTAGYVDYWRRHPKVAEVVALPPSRRLRRPTWRRILLARAAARPLRGRYGAVVSFEPYAVPDHFALVRGLGARVNVGFNKHTFRLFTYSLEERRHGVVAESVATRTARVMEVFGRRIDCRTLRFHVPHDAQDDEAARAAVRALPPPGPRLLFNVYGHGPEKRLTPESAARGVLEIRRAGHAGPIFLSVPDGEGETYDAALREAGMASGVSTIQPFPDYFKLFAFVGMMDVVVSPDTAVGHVAAAFRLPQATLFAEGGTVPVAWKPYNDRCVGVLSQDTKNVNTLCWDAFEEAVGEILSRVGDGQPDAWQADLGPTGLPQG